MIAAAVVDFGLSMRELAEISPRQLCAIAERWTARFPRRDKPAAESQPSAPLPVEQQIAMARSLTDMMRSRHPARRKRNGS